MFWRLYCQETRERALQGARNSSRGARARLPWEVHSNRAGDSGTSVNGGDSWWI